MYAAGRASRGGVYVDWWWSRQTERRPYYRPSELRRAVGVPMRSIAEALRVRGWRRVVRRGVDDTPRQRVIWVPPGSTLKLRPRGRPRFDLLQALGSAQQTLP